MSIEGISSTPSSFYATPKTNYGQPQGKPEGFQGNGGDCFVRDQDKDYEKQKAFQDAGNIFMKHHHKPNKGGGAGPVNGTRPGENIEEGISMYPGRTGYDKSFLGIDLGLPTLGPSIKDKAAVRTDNGDTELTYTNFSVVMNKERRQCFYAICNIDGSQLQNIPRSGSWTIDGRIPRDQQLGNEAYSNNDIDKGHMVRRLDPCWGPQAQRANDDSFAYTNATLQHANLNQQEWLELENHVLDSAKGQKMTVITGPVLSENDPVFTNHGKINPPTQMPTKFWKVVVWNDKQSGQLKGAAFVLSQEDILQRDGNLFKNVGFEPGRFSTYQVPVSQLEQMTDLKFGAFTDITDHACKLTAADDYRPQGLD